MIDDEVAVRVVENLFPVWNSFRKRKLFEMLEYVDGFHHSMSKSAFQLGADDCCDKFKSSRVIDEWTKMIISVFNLRVVRVIGFDRHVSSSETATVILFLFL